MLTFSYINQKIENTRYFPYFYVSVIIIKKIRRRKKRNTKKIFYPKNQPIHLRSKCRTYIWYAIICKCYMTRIILSSIWYEPPHTYTHSYINSVYHFVKKYRKKSINLCFFFLLSTCLIVICMYGTIHKYFWFKKYRNFSYTHTHTHITQIQAAIFFMHAFFC